MRKMWRHPHTEIWIFYAIDTVACGAIITAGPFGWQELVYPVYLLVVNALCVLIIVAARSRSELSRIAASTENA